MAFNSLAFLIFIALFLAVWPHLKGARLTRYITLTTASFIFYGWWDWRFLFLIITSGTVDFIAAQLMEKTSAPKKRKLILIASLMVNLGALGIFKYAGWLADIIDASLGTHLKSSIPPFALILPVGISFYTFQSLSYTIDVYRGQVRATKSWLHYMSYLAMFPQLVAGPIIRASSLLWQLEKAPNPTAPQLHAATKLIVTGYIQKLLIADNLAPYVDKAFAAPTASMGTVFWWAVMGAFAVQIYCDFAGYSNIARGLVKYMGWNIPANFKFPYLAKGFRDFWNRWHISLSHWFRDYVYIPLGGALAMWCMWVTLILSGLWHGAAFTFVLWGAVHAAYLHLERQTKWPKRLSNLPFIGGWLTIMVTFALTCVAWVFFRSANLPDATHILSNMLIPTAPEHVKINFPIAIFAAFIIIETWGYIRPMRYLARINATLAKHTEIIALSLALSLAIMLRGEGHGFIYFQF